ncbi:glycosyltransferase family 4 protein [Methylomicrobium lacus]|uniref:glycosyltransferase family 4 protein n=1 Tax=Methylomicrobium lacus TaxID=136992 RepID=UPI0035A86CB9
MANKFFFLNGGSETVFFQERDFLVDSGVSVVDFSMQDERNRHSAYSNYFVSSRQYKQGASLVQKIESASSLIHSPEAVKHISALIDAERPDIVHCHNIYHQLTPSIIGAAKKFGVPIVLTLHDYKPVCPAYVRLHDEKMCSACLDGDFSNVIKYRCADGSLGKSALLYAEAVVQKLLGNYEKLDAVIAPSQFMAESVASRFSPEKVKVIYNGIDIDKVRASAEDDGYVLYLGRLSQEKGIATLLEAYRRNDIRLPLKICGTGPLLDQLLMDVPPNVELLGYQTGEALKSIISKASLVSVPSEWYENCPMSVLEAMAYGKPVVASQVGGIPELVADGISGLLHEPGNADALSACIDKLADDVELRKMMGRNARQRVEDSFSLAQHNAALLAVYRDLTNDFKGR